MGNAPVPIVVDDWRTLGTSNLPAVAREYYRDRGISDLVARDNNLRFLPPEVTVAIWGPNARSEALLFPHSKGYATARLLEWDGEGKFRCTPDKGSRLYEPVLPQSFGVTFAEVRADPSHDLIIGEGPTRALAAVSHGDKACSIGGSWNWQRNREPLSALLKYEWRGRNVTPVFDADITDNNNVALPYILFGDWLDSQGAKVQYARVLGKQGSKRGLDDLYEKYGKQALGRLRREDWNESTELEKLRISVLRTTEGGLAALFVAQYGGDVRYDNEQECWYVWNGNLYVRQPARAPDVQEALKASIAWIMTEANKITNEQRRKSMRAWGTRCDSQRVIRGAMGLASSAPRLRVGMAELDRDPHLLGTPSEILDLRTGRRMRGERGQLITRAIGTTYDAAAKCPRWERFVSEVMCKDSGMVAFMQRLVGYFLIGGNPERLIFFLYGVGRNGKSVFIETLLKLMGDYGGPAKSELIMKHRLDRDSESPQPFMLELRGLRYITASEVAEGRELDAATVKNLAGGDEITVRGLHAAPVRFTVEGKFVVRCNHRPIIDGADQAIWDRIVEIPFDLRLEEEQQDRGLRDALLDELPGILNWALQGCLEYQAKGLQVPNRVRKQVAAYRESMDTFATWLKERTREESTARTRPGVLYADYERWCAMASKPGVLVFAVSQREFALKLQERGYIRKKRRGLHFWRGIRLSKEPL